MYVWMCVCTSVILCICRGDNAFLNVIIIDAGYCECE